ncbi:MAG: glucan 1,4-alpha-glucosidase [Firmicutes bacterium]|nr:glucan 1,4-alpha-glucosidase [Alicyclobacillaceae bacterium]MCL6497339.1 glucan 1,4-alpha-glucosidase [Bacillota bacterium]
MDAPGGPGIEPRWTSSAKTGVGTAINPRSRVWFTISHGILNELYYPRIDIATIRDAELLVVSKDGEFWEEKRDLLHRQLYIDPEAPGFVLINEEPHGRFRIVKRVVTWPQGDVLLQQIRFEVPRGDPKDWRVYCLVAPHLGNQGMGNSAVIEGQPGTSAVIGRAWREHLHLVVTARPGFKAGSVGFVGASDGWTQLHGDRRLVEYDRALDGNVAITLELDLERGWEHTVALAFGAEAGEAELAARLALLYPYDVVERQYVSEWKRYMSGLPGLLPLDQPHAKMQRISAMVLRVHRDKQFPGAIIASLSIPWGEACGDQNIGGYHLVWPRDLVESASALLALGDTEGARHALEYLMATQAPDGSWPQNFWVDGRPYWSGSQLDETAFPIHLAYHLTQIEPARTAFFYPMVRRALAYIARNGPVTQQDRWEENSGYSAATLAAVITALVLGGAMARHQGEVTVAEFVEALADGWAAMVDAWTYTHEGTVLPGHPCHYQRIHPAAPVAEDGNIHHGFVPIKNQPPGVDPLVPEGAVIDPGFLELVRYGIKAPDDPHILTSLAVVDQVLKVDMPYGPLWHRYNRDGYGEAEDGSPYRGWGVGRLWPLLTGERGHYELARGNDPEPYLATMEQAAGDGGLIPEQVWDGPDLPERELWHGRPSGSAMPLVWAHAEFVKLLRSAREGAVFERYPVVARRYAGGLRRHLYIWHWSQPMAFWPADAAEVRIVVPRPARLVITHDDWQTHREVDLEASGLGMYYYDVVVFGLDAVEFTFFWTDTGTWEGRNFRCHREKDRVTAHPALGR